MDVHSRKIKSESHFTKRTNITESNVNSLSFRKINNVLIVFKFKIKKNGVVKGLAMICRPNHNFKIPCEFTKGEGCHTMILIKVGLKSKKHHFTSWPTM